MTQFQSKINTEVYSSFCGYLYQFGYYSYFIKFGLGLGEDAKGSFALFDLCLLGCQSFEKLFYKKATHKMLMKLTPFRKK